MEGFFIKNETGPNKKQPWKIVLIIAAIVVVCMIGLTAYLSVSGPNRSETPISETSAQEAALANLSQNDTTYQSLYPEYEIAYVYLMSAFFKQLDGLESGETTEESFNKVIDDFKELVSDFLKRVPDTADTFKESRDAAVSSAQKTQDALNHFEELIDETGITNNEISIDHLSDALDDFKESQITFKETMDSLK